MNTEVQRLLDALDDIKTRASCAPDDDPKVVGLEFTKIMLRAREARMRFDRECPERFTLTGLGWLVATEGAS